MVISRPDKESFREFAAYHSASARPASRPPVQAA